MLAHDHEPGDLKVGGWPEVEQRGDAVGAVGSIPERNVEDRILGHDLESPGGVTQTPLTIFEKPCPSGLKRAVELVHEDASGHIEDLARCGDCRDLSVVAGIESGPAIQPIDSPSTAREPVISGPADKPVVTLLAEEHVAATLTFQEVTIVAAVQLVTLTPSEESISSGTSTNDVAATESMDDVISAQADDHIVARRPVEDVVAVGTRERCGQSATSRSWLCSGTLNSEEQGRHKSQHNEDNSKLNTRHDDHPSRPNFQNLARSVAETERAS